MASYGIADHIRSALPNFDDAVILFPIGKQAAFKISLNGFLFCQGLVYDFSFIGRNGDIRNRQGIA